MVGKNSFDGFSALLSAPRGKRPRLRPPVRPIRRQAPRQTVLLYAIPAGAAYVFAASL